MPLVMVPWNPTYLGPRLGHPVNETDAIGDGSVPETESQTQAELLITNIVTMIVSVTVGVTYTV